MERERWTNERLVSHMRDTVHIPSPRRTHKGHCVSLLFYSGQAWIIFSLTWWKFCLSVYFIVPHRILSFIFSPATPLSLTSVLLHLPRNNGSALLSKKRAESKRQWLPPGGRNVKVGLICRVHWYLLPSSVYLCSTAWFVINKAEPIFFEAGDILAAGPSSRQRMHYNFTQSKPLPYRRCFVLAQ